jgi:hypothetical protein
MRALPAVPVDDFAGRPAAGPDVRPQRPVGGIAQADRVDGEVAVGVSQDPLCLLLVKDWQPADRTGERMGSWLAGARKAAVTSDLLIVLTYKLGVRAVRAHGRFRATEIGQPHPEANAGF